MAQYAKELPIDKNNNPYTVATPAFRSNQSWSSVFTVSSTVGLNANTTVVQLSAVGAPANFNWGVASVTSTSFDGTIPAGQAITFVVPQSVAGVSSLAGANVANGLFGNISIRTVGGNTGSVFGAEY